MPDALTALRPSITPSDTAFTLRRLPQKGMVFAGTDMFEIEDVKTALMVTNIYPIEAVSSNDS
ncbi:hypothetical protein FQ192_07975 [Pseudomonas sp. ANT_J12]|jgi:hypothetical protein|uniref:hypothetical protein n=1 Tax=Pseudomonas sp. ANT_J12 TaxID=2597351 RepID=UPI0011F33408|nr:hypothetical protein [Pseudomonas sp. ANT_J12]KAA0995966.1 hypothetical protein FQ192_07975 [Pseudomonas sp. ANT_J12]